MTSDELIVRLKSHLHGANIRVSQLEKRVEKLQECLASKDAQILAYEELLPKPVNPRGRNKRERVEGVYQLREAA